MGLTEAEGPAGAPWERPLAGSLDQLVVELRAAGGQPAGRPRAAAAVGLPPAGRRARPPGRAAERLRDPGVHRASSTCGQNRTRGSGTCIERLDEMFAAGDCPDAIVVFVDAGPPTAARSSSTRPRTGPYQSYLCDEVVPFVDERYPVAADRDRRAPQRQVLGRLRRDGRADDAPGRLRRPRLARGRRPVRVRLPRPTSATSRASCATSTTAPTTSSSSASPRPRRSASTSSAGRSRSTATPPATRPTPSARARRCCRSRSTPAASSTRSGSSGWRSTRCGWRPATPRSCARCAGSTSTPGAGTSTTSTSGRRPSPTELTTLGVDHYARALRRQARRAHLPLPGRDPGAASRRLWPLRQPRRTASRRRRRAPSRRLGEVGEPHPEQADRPLGPVGAQQLDRDRGDRLGVAHRSRRACAPGSASRSRRGGP